MHTNTSADLLTVRDLTSALHISRQRVHQLARAYGIGYHYGGRLLFTQADLNFLLRRPTTPGPRRTEPA